MKIRSKDMRTSGHMVACESHGFFRIYEFYYKSKLSAKRGLRTKSIIQNHVMSYVKNSHRSIIKDPYDD